MEQVGRKVETSLNNAESNNVLTQPEPDDSDVCYDEEYYKEYVSENGITFVG